MNNRIITDGIELNRKRDGATGAAKTQRDMFAGRSAASIVLRTAAVQILREADITFRYAKNDLTASVAPCFITMLSVSPWQQASIFTFLFSSMRCLVYAFCYCMVVVTCNQLKSKEEDAIEKPFRPIPAGLVTMQGAKSRIALWASLYMSLSFMLGIGHWGMLWILVSVHQNFLGGHKHWFTKNCTFLSSGVAVQIGSIWQISCGDMTTVTWIWTIGISLWAGLFGNIQDFRDVRGDKTLGRQTMPIVYGYRARWILAGCSILCGLILSTTLIVISQRLFEKVIALSVGVGHIVMSSHLLLRKDHEGDKVSYKILILLFNIILATSGIWLR